MENWGLITYRTTAVLFDEEQSDAKYKNRVAYVVAHGRAPTSITFGCAADYYLELAHQWFGNLVTMDWWNELWLNEGFATWVGWLAVNHLYPDHEVWSQVRTLFSLFFHFRIHVPDFMYAWGARRVFLVPEVALSMRDIP